MTLYRLSTLYRGNQTNLMFKKFILYITIPSLFRVIAPAQEVVTGLQTNIRITDISGRNDAKKGIKAADTLELPFFDDFSGHSPFPDEGRWSDINVFINNTYSDRQITTGVATFDAINNSGTLYETASSTGFEADHLTSQPLNLDFSPAENIWLSFFYEPGGLGDEPEPGDSLTLQFFAPAENKWFSIWRAAGSDQRGFKPEIIRIDHPRYLRKGFRFRFVNYASLSSGISDPAMRGNCDHWNLDYVILDRGRNAADTSVADVAFRTPLRSVLKTHEAMPWKQFRQAYLQEMGSAIPIHYRNNDIITRNVTRNFNIRDVYRNLSVHSFSAGATNISPWTNVDYNAGLIYTFDSNNSDSARFLITCYLITDDFDPKENDTIKYIQDFSNYFAFDDGTSEGGYGINGMGSRNAMAALRFRSYITDTLRAVQICFNDSYLNSNKRAFDLMVWDDNNGIPGNVLYSYEEFMVEKGEGINGFHTYVLPDGVEVAGVFYVGWKQRSETFLNAGFDVNTLHNGKQFYWLNGEWRMSQVQGSLMIRPVTGDPLKTTSSDDISTSPIDNSFIIFPNPASDVINVLLPGGIPLGPVNISFYDLHGREMKRVQYNQQIDISFLSKGTYIVVVTADGRKTGHMKLVKLR